MQYASEVFVFLPWRFEGPKSLSVAACVRRDRYATYCPLRLLGLTPQAEGRPMKTHRLRALPSETWSVVRYH